jgi:hypothetical protein
MNAVSDFLDTVPHPAFVFNIHWAHQSRLLYLRIETESSLRNVDLNKRRTVDNVQKVSNCIGEFHESVCEDVTMLRVFLLPETDACNSEICCSHSLLTPNPSPASFDTTG